MDAKRWCDCARMESRRPWILAGKQGTFTSTFFTKRRGRDSFGVRARRREVEEQAGHKEKLPSDAKLLKHVGAVKGQLFGDESRAAVILRQLLDGPIRVVLFMRIDGKRVVPRLEFTINLVAALRSAVANAAVGQGRRGRGSPGVAAGCCWR